MCGGGGQKGAAGTTQPMDGEGRQGVWGGCRKPGVCQGGCCVHSRSGTRETATSRGGRRAAACTTCVACHPAGESVGGICCSPLSSLLKFCGSHANELSSQIKQEIGLAPTHPPHPSGTRLLGAATSAFLSASAYGGFHVRTRAHTSAHTLRKCKTKQLDWRQRDNNSTQREMELAFSSPI